MKHEAQPKPGTIGDARGGIFYAECQTCGRMIWTNRAWKIGTGWTHDDPTIIKGQK